jgi:hypothetical protein
VATRTIEAGDIILKENPLTFGPSLESETPICLGCCKEVTTKSPRCEKCGFPVCSKVCADSKMHQNECKVLMKKGWFKSLPIGEFFKPSETCYPIITPLRTFLLRENDPEVWALILSLMSNMTTSFQSLEAVTAIISKLRATIDLKEEDIPTITKIVGILNVNSFGDLEDKGISN